MSSTKPPTTLLLVDDFPTNLDLLFHGLARANYHVLIANNGEQALRQAALAHPDLILLDVMMPQMDGFETCRRLKADPATRDIPVIFMTALAEAVDEVKGLQLGAVDYVTKPIQIKRLIARLEVHLANRRLKQQLQAQVGELAVFAQALTATLQTPLDRLAQTADLALAGYASLPPEQLEDHLRTMAASGRAAARVAEELAWLARLSQPDQPPFEPLAMADIVGRALERLAGAVAAAGARVLLPAAWPAARGYAPWIEEVWVHYVGNGLAYGGQPPVLELGADTPAEGQIRFWVKDDGPGLTAEAQAGLFTDFGQRAPAGSEGLGLAVVRRILDRSGGRAGVTSTPGLGSLFYFILPAQDAAA